MIFLGLSGTLSSSYHSFKYTKQTMKQIKKQAQKPVKKHTMQNPQQAARKVIPAVLVLSAMFGLSACQHAGSTHPANTPATTSYALEADEHALKAGEANAPKNTEQCGDYLALMGKKPIELTFLGCNASFHDNTHALIANYRLKGKDVLSVQEQLHKLSGMPRLTKDCCHWESINSSTGESVGVVQFRGSDYFISMQSAELRLGWNIASDIKNIPYFNVHVIYPLPTHKQGVSVYR